MDDINNMWRKAVVCVICRDAKWIIYEKPMKELYGDETPVRFAKPCTACNRVRIPVRKD